MQLYSTGSNSNGQLGHGDDEDSHVFLPVHLPSTCSSVDSLAFGGTHTLLLSRGRVFVAGSNIRGQLGPHTMVDQDRSANQLSFVELPVDNLLRASCIASTTHVRDPISWKVKAVAAAWETSFVVLEDKEQLRDDVLLVFGANDWSEWANAKPHSDQYCGGVGVIKLDASPVEQTSRKRVVVHSISAGPRHIIVALSQADIVLVGWGAARHGQLGIQDRPSKTMSEPTRVELPQEIVDKETSFVSCSIGRDHTALLLRDSGSGRLKVILLGSSRLGQLGPAPVTPSSNVIQFDSDEITELKVGTTWSGTYILELRTGEPLSLHAFGLNTRGQLAQPADRDATTVQSASISLLKGSSQQIACGSEHVLALADDGLVHGWGWNEHGNIGVNHTQDVFSPVKIGGLLPGKVAGIWAGNATSWLLLQDDNRAAHGP